MSTEMSTPNDKTPKGLGSEYDVGYGKPPVSGQFKPGSSGNKKGRPKGSKNFSTDLKDVLASKTVVTLEGKPKKITTQRAALERLRQKALQGDARALDKMLDLAQQISESQETRQRSRSLAKDDAAILERFISRQTSEGSEPHEL